MDIEDLKIGDWLFTFQSEIINRDTPFLDYNFHQIKSETKNYWVLGQGYYKVRKTDLKIRGEVYKFMHYMNDEIWKIKKQRDEWMKKRS